MILAKKGLELHQCANAAIVKWNGNFFSSYKLFFRRKHRKSEKSTHFKKANEWAFLFLACFEKHSKTQEAEQESVWVFFFPVKGYTSFTMSLYCIKEI